MKINIGANIKRLRLAENVTQEQLAEAMHVTCASVSKWERGETFPDITLLQPLAYYFDVSLDELMGYDQEKVQQDIAETIALYRKSRNNGDEKSRDLITKAYQEYPNDYRIMHEYMWNLAGDLSDNNSAVLLNHKDEFLMICDKILRGCTEEALRLSAWNMRAKILHAENKTEESLEIYKTKFADWYNTCGQKEEQLFAKDTDEYYDCVQKNMYELANFAADKLGKTILFNKNYSLEEKIVKACQYSDCLTTIFEETHDPFFLVLARSLLGRMENDLVYRFGEDAAIIKDRRAQLLKNPAYAEVLNKYK